MEFVTENYIWVITALMSAVGLVIITVRERMSGPRLSPAQATQLINREDAQVVDVREQAEWSKGHINGARNIPAGQIATRLDELAKFRQRPVIVTCTSGNRSASACAALRKAGFEKVFALDGGLGAWEQAGLPLAKK
ncbi:MAG: rhodanese-like domain-containing protein [Methyloversatilis sp.]|nr:rhodanese-like domain-containing protein [Methyloversatilis sp.]MBP6193133.1 rhodanese-like domain-containing protein [Methyloversatilis sp.]MBP9116639.1 rhodanese-like domain-containing protein [Methyloversatilis sp.]